MTGGDDHLAPVTPLFGQRGAARRGGPTQDHLGSESHGEWSSDDAWATVDGPGADESMSDQPGAEAPGGGEADAASSATQAVVSALPTYAAFAAKSEAPPRYPVTFGGSAGAEGPDAEKVGFDDAESEETREAAQQRAENISLHALSRRGVSSSEMAKTLRSRDLPEDVVTAEVERLERVGLLDDAELAENLVRSKQERKGLGKGAITSELRQRGLAQEAIDQAIADIDDDDEQARADEWALKRAGQLRGLDQATAERRLNGFLMRRGYRSEVIRRAVERALPRGGSGRGGVRFE